MFFHFLVRIVSTMRLLQFNFSSVLNFHGLCYKVYLYINMIYIESVL